MLTISTQNNVLAVEIMGELTLADYNEFESAILDGIKDKRINLLIDLTQMSGFTVDVVWEDIRFIRGHAHDFARIAAVTTDQWQSWLAWINSAFTDAEVEIFHDLTAARVWLFS